MLEAAAALRRAGNALSGAAPSLSGAVQNTGSQGPFFSEMAHELGIVSRRIQTGGNGFQQLAHRLELEAKSEQAIRRAELTRASLDPSYVPPFKR